MLKKSVKITGGLRTPAIEEVNKPISTSSKSKIRYEIEKNIGDHEDITADISNMLSLTMSMIFMMWDSMSDEQKSKIDETHRGFIDYARNKFKDTLTLADIKFKQNGVAEIDKLLGRQGHIGEIVMREMNYSI